MYLTLAYRNIWRNRRRTLITILSITFAVLLACIMRSMQLGSYDKMIENSVRFHTGYIQIHKKGYWDDKVIDNSMPMDTSVIQSMTRVPGVDAYVPRLESFALASHGTQTKGAMVMGIDPEREHQLTLLKDKVVEGRYLTSGDEGVMIGQGLAEYLKIGVGDTLVLLGQGYHGASAAGLYPVQGILRFPLPQQNDQLVYLSLPTAQWLYGADNMVTTVALLIDDPDHTEKIVRDIRSQIDMEEYEVMDWKELVPELVQNIELDNVSGRIMLWVLYLVIGFGMFGTYLMMTAERIYEFGVMIAVGMRRFRLQGLVFLEILMMSVMGVLAGICLSLPVLIYFNKNPIRFPEEVGEMVETFGMEPVYAFSLDPVIFTNQAYAIFFMAIILSGYPIWKIQRMKVVESMRL
ncbi:MAG: ABC transporter permease [Bacteroidota bacterium]|jgi:ABC-type lipoprotein release transport system permease subunit|nr:MAG: ABC transporter permease [Bacteroidota bacterium]